MGGRSDLGPTDEERVASNRRYGARLELLADDRHRRSTRRWFGGRGERVHGKDRRWIDAIPGATSVCPLLRGSVEQSVGGDQQPAARFQTVCPSERMNDTFVSRL